MSLRHASLSIAALLLATIVRGAELRIPAFTAYTLPDSEGARVSESRGVTRWTNPAVSVNWYGQFEKQGPLKVRLILRLPAGAESNLKLAVDGQSRELTVRGAASEVPIMADFGEFQIESSGYRRFALECLNPANRACGDLDALILEGAAVQGAHFNLKERRNAASVHLAYPVPVGTNVAAFDREITAVEDPPATFYMACGWHRGYFGMQINSPSERRIIFSVWDSGGEAVDRKKVAEENRVRLMAKGEGVFSGDFGNEGTGGHSHLKFPWKTGDTQRFLVTARPVDGTFTVFSGFYRRPDRDEWMLISSWKAPNEGGWLRRLHSFSENFSGGNGHLVRKAFYGNQWIRTESGQWIELVAATFSHDPSGKADRLDRFMGVEGARFFLSHGGFGPGYTAFGEPFHRHASGAPPSRLPPNLFESDSPH